MAKIIPVAVIMGPIIFCIGRRYARGDRSWELLSKDVTAFLEECEKVYALLAVHQAGKPVDGTVSLTGSREKISLPMKALAAKREHIGLQLSHPEAEHFQSKYLFWKDQMNGDVGLITSKASACPRHLVKMEAAHKNFVKQLIQLRQRIAQAKVKMRSYSQISK